MFQYQDPVSREIRPGTHDSLVRYAYRISDLVPIRFQISYRVGHTLYRILYGMLVRYDKLIGIARAIIASPFSRTNSSGYFRLLAANILNPIPSFQSCGPHTMNM